ncbi:unnamed protein product [Boreogadus saida]
MSTLQTLRGLRPPRGVWSPSASLPSPPPGEGLHLLRRDTACQGHVVSGEGGGGGPELAKGATPGEARLLGQLKMLGYSLVKPGCWGS